MAPGIAFASGFSQFVALLYKQLLLKKSHYFCTTFEIIFPIIIASIPCMLYSSVADYKQGHRDEFKWFNYTTFEHFDPMTEYSRSRTDNLEFVYSPSNDVTDEFMRDSIRTFFGNRYVDGISDPVQKNSEKELENYILNETKWDEDKILIGTVFKGFDDKLPTDLDYKIYYTKSVDTLKKYVLNGPEISSEYRFSFFLQWQTSVGDTFIRKKAAKLNKNIDYKVFLQTFPYPEYRYTPENFFNRNDVETCIHLGLVIFVTAMVKRIIEERNDGSKELMEKMGMTRCPYWASTFTSNFMSAFIIALVVSIIYKASNRNTVFYMQTDFMILFIVLLLFMANLILFCMAFSIFFNRVVYAVLALMGVYLLSYILLMYKIYSDSMYEGYYSLSLFHKLCVCIYPSGGLVTAALVIHLFEFGNEGVQWSNLTDYAQVPDINMLMVMGMMTFSILFYIVVIWYFDTVWPFRPGVYKPFYFFLTKSYWFGEKSVAAGDIELARSVGTVDNFEEEPNDAVRSVVIKDLTKVISQGKEMEVLHNVSLNCYQGQITILLGYGEAGKSSLINILAGKELPTKGFVSVNGLDNSKNTTSKHLGVCPQHNTLHEDLTVEQHLKIYAGVKGTPLGRLGYEAEEVLNTLKLSNRKYEMVSDLSYSDKRKLSVAISIVSGSRVLLLDEPTYGLDAESKKHVWDALLSMKDNHTIIVSTQSYEEADILGDRIAVMAGGEIQSCGTPAFLKQKLGAGNHLHVQKDMNSDSHAIASLVKMHVSSVTCENESNKEISFNLGDAAKLGDLFDELEKSKSKLGVISYGVSSSTLKDVLLTVSNMFHQKQNVLTGNTNTEMEDESTDSLHPVVQASLGSQFLALMVKHIHSSKRRWRYHVIQLSIPFILMFACCYYMKDTVKLPYQPLKLDISNVYGSTDGFYYINDASLSYLTETFKNVLKSNEISVAEVNEPTHYILDYGNKDLTKYIKRLVVGGTISKFQNGPMNLTAWYNSATVHSLPMSLLLMQTALLRYVANAGKMSLTFVPILPVMEKYARADKEDVGASGWPMYFLPLAFTLLSLSFILKPIQEKATKAKLLQLMSGIPTSIYWIATFLWDYLIYFVICLFMIVPPVIFAPSIFAGAHSKAIGSFLLFFFLYGWASLPLGYIVSILVKRENQGLTIFIMICIIFSVVYVALLNPMIAFLFLKSHKTLLRLNDAEWFFYLFPAYSASSGARNSIRIAYHNAACDMFTQKDLTRCSTASETTTPTLLSCCKDICINHDCHKTMDYLSWENKLFVSNGPVALYLGIEGIVFFAILFLLETRTGTRFLDKIKLHFERISNQFTRMVLRKGLRHQVLRENITEDPQVIQEEERIRNSTSTQQASGGEALVVLELAKQCENFSTVNRLTFGVNGVDHFGILGEKDAGKTSTFRMLTGDDMPSEGNAFLQGYSLRGDFRRFQSRLGYCPEVNPLIDGLTGREMLLLHGQLRGLRGPNLQYNVNQLIQRLELTHCVDEITEFYSAGDKRKLSVALALIGSPPVLLLDEPTSRVDLQTRRQIWKAVIRARKSNGAAVLLATQSIEEGEALCNRVAIMANGRFRCLSSVGQLKPKHGQGYMLTFKISKEHQSNAEKVNSLREFIHVSLQNVTLKEDYQGKFLYQVTNPSLTVGCLFKFMLDLKSKFEIEDYSIGVISLAQTFVDYSLV